MAAPQSTSSSPNSSQNQPETIFQQLEAYPWSSDTEFQSGLQAILGPDPSPDQAKHLTLRARCFYYSRKNNVPVDFNEYQTWRAKHAASSSSSNSENINAGLALSSDANSNVSSTVSPASHKPNTATDATEPPAPYPFSFTQIVDLITNGQPIPGIKDVPDTVLKGQASQTSNARRKKPWEKNDIESKEDAVAIADRA